MSSRSNPKRVVRYSHIQLGEKEVGHLRVVVLPRVHENVFHLWQTCTNRRDNWSHLYEVGTGAHHIYDHHAARLLMIAVSDLPWFAAAPWPTRLASALDLLGVGTRTNLTPTG